MKGLVVASRLAQAIHNRTGWRFPKLVAIKVGLKAIQLCELVLKRRKLEFQIRIRHLRVCYLHSQLAQRKFDIGICTTLRGLEKCLDRADSLGQLAGGITGIPDKFQNVTKHIEVEIHNILLFEKAYAAFKGNTEHGHSGAIRSSGKASKEGRSGKPLND